ncbi:hypothetical protein A9Q99_03110 [Gammaproteobacteria bacterium 45_16_T64]|nr:hypothetical protein A9Q99_03110 [Gammaproteobacteria bacterium 45_16_T64]
MGLFGKKPSFTAICSSLLVSSSLVVSSFAMAVSDPSAAPVTRLIVKFKPTTGATAQARGVMKRSVLDIVAEKSGANLQPLRNMANGAQVISLGRERTLSEAQQVIKHLVTDPSIEYAEPDLLMVPMAVPNDPQYANQWHYYEATGGLNVESAWEVEDGDDVVVAVLDTGYRPHEDLMGNILPGYDFVSTTDMSNDGDGRDADASDPGDAMVIGECGGGFPEEDIASSWHGTHVAGTIAAIANNGIGVSGVAPKAKVVPVRVLGVCGGYTSDITDAVLWAAGISVDGVPDNQNPAQVINMSLGSSSPAGCGQSYADTIAAARAAGAIVVVAAGNSNANADTYPPGNCSGAFTVAANNRSGGRAYYSNYGSLVDVTAPGGAQFFANDDNGVLSTSNGGASAPGEDVYSYYQGTSMATPHVAGVAALLFGANGNLTVSEVEDALRNTARAFPASCTGCGTGIVDANQAVQFALGNVALVDRANLALTLTGDNGKFKKSEEDSSIGTIRYIADIVNNGVDVATNIVLESVYPEEVTAVTTMSDDAVCDSGGLICEVASLDVGESASVIIEVTTGNSKSMSFNASVSSDLLDPDTSDNIVIKKFGGSFGIFVLIMLSISLGVRRKALA